MSMRCGSYATLGLNMYFRVLALAFLMVFAEAAANAQDHPIQIPSDQFDRQVYAASLSDRITRSRDYDKVALAQIIVLAYMQNPNIDPTQLTLSLNKAQAEYDSQKQLAGSAEGYQYFSRDDLHKADLMFKAASQIPGVKPYSDLSKDVFDEEVYQVNKKLSPEAQIASQSEQYSLFARTQEAQDTTLSRLAELGNSNPRAAEVIDHVFANYAGAKVTDKALVIAQGNPAFKDSQTLQYIASSVGPNGQINITLEEFRAKYDSDMTNMFNAVNQNRVLLSDIQTRLKRQEEIAMAKEKAAEAEQQRELMISAARAGVFIFSSFVGDKKTSHDISVAGNTIISMADEINKYKDIAAGSFATSGLSAVILTGNMLSGAMTIASLFSDPTETPDAMILSQLREIQHTLSIMRDEMHYRFDRIEVSLNEIYGGLLRALAQIDLDIGRVNGRVADIQATLLEFELRLNRLQASIYFYLNDLSNRMTNKSVTYCLDFTELYAPAVLDEVDYRHCQSDFLTWAISDSRDRLASPLPASSPSQPSFSGEVRQFPLPSKINLLMQVASQLDSSYLPPSQNLANPVVWAAGSEAYIQMARQSPAYFDKYPAEGVNRLTGTGKELESFLSLLVMTSSKKPGPNYRLIDNLVSNYLKSTDLFVKNGNDIGKDFTDHEGHGLDLWKDANQATTYTADALNSAAELNVTGQTPAILALTPQMAGLIPNAVLNAEQLGLGKISFSLAAAAVEESTSQFGGDRFKAYNAYYKVQVELDGTFDGKLVVRRIVTAPKPLLVCPVAGANQGCDAQTINVWLPPTVKKIWSDDQNIRQLLISSSTDVAAGDATYQTSIKEFTDKANKQILQLRGAYYSNLASELSRGGPYRDSSQVMDGAKDLIELYLSFALPTSLATDEDLHASMFGINGLLDTDRALQLFSSSARSSSSQTKVVDVAAVIRGRSSTLKVRVHGRLSELANHHIKEHQAVVEDTLDDLARLSEKHGTLKESLDQVSALIDQIQETSLH